MSVRVHLHFQKNPTICPPAPLPWTLTLDHIEVEPTLGGMLKMALYYPGPYPYWKGGRRHHGDLPMKVIVEIAAISMARNHSETLKASVQQVLGACLGVGEEITIDKIPIKEAQELVKQGHFDSMIKEVETEIKAT